MADQTKNLILKLKLETDASSGAVITKLFKEHETSAERLLKTSKALKDVDTDRVSVLNNSLSISKAYSSGITGLLELQKSKQAQLLNDLNEKIAKGNITIEKHGRGWNLVEAGIQRSIEKHNRLSQLLATETNEQVKALEVLKKQEDILASSIALRAKLKTPLDSRTTSVSDTPQVSTDVISNAQAGYARQRISDEETLANRLRNIELNALRSSIQESSSIRQSNFQRELQEQIATVNRIQAIRTTAFNASLREEEAIMRSSIEIQTAIAVHGINSVQAQRARANEVTRQAEQTLQAELSSIRSSVSGGRLSPSQGTAASATATRAYTETILNSNAALHEHERAVANVTERHRNMFLRVGELIGSYQIWNLGINAITGSLKAIPHIGIELESTVASLTATTGSAHGMESTMIALEKEAHRTGISINTLRETFRGFQASTSLAGETIQSTWHMFTDLNTVITGLHLPSEKASGIFLAMAQIFNKTKVQSEELVKQLGNLLPGAFASFAAANNVAFGGQFKNSIDLINQMKKGTVFAHDTVQRFTTFMAERFAPAFALASQGLNATIGRMQTSFTLLGEAVYTSTSGLIIGVTKAIASFADYIKDAVNGANNFGTILKDVVIVALISLTAATIKSINTSIINTAVKLNEARAITTTALASRNAMVAITGTTVATATMSTATAFATIGNNLLAKSMVFLTSPTAIVAGLAIITLGFYELYKSENAATDALNDHIKKRNENLDKPKDPESLSFRISEDPEVKRLEASIKAQEDMITLWEAKRRKAFGIGGGGTDEASYLTTKINEAKKQINSVIPDLNILKEKAKLELTISTTGASKDLTLISDKMSILALQAKGLTVEAAQMQFNITHSGDIAEMEKVVNKMEAIVPKILSLTPVAGISQPMVRDLSKSDIKAKVEAEERYIDKIRAEYKSRENVVSIDTAFNAETSQLRKDIADYAIAKEYQINTDTARNKAGLDKQLADEKAYASVSFQIEEGKYTAKATLDQVSKKAEYDAKEKALSQTAILDDRERQLKTQTETPEILNKLKTIGEQRVGIEVGIGVAIQKAKDDFNKQSESTRKAGADAEHKIIRDNYKDIIRDSKDATLAIEDDLLRLEYARQDQIMSVKDFYAQKKVLQDRDYQQQIESTNKLLDIAKSSGDIASVNKYNDLLREKAQAQLKLEEVGKRTYIVESRAYALQLIDNKAKDASNKLITEQDNISNRYLSGLTNEVTYIAEVTALKLKEIDIIKEKNKGLQEQINLEGELAQSPLEKIKLRQDIEANKAQIASKSAPSSLGNDIATRFGNSELGSLATSSLKLNSEKATLESDRLLATSAVTIDPNLPALEAHKKFVADKEKIDIDYSKKSSILNLDYYSGITSMAANAALSMTSMAIKAYGAQSTQAKIAFAAYKVFKIAEIIMDTASLAMKLSLSQAMIPFVGIAMAELGPPMAYAMGAIQLAMVMSAPMPAAHGGLDYVPAEQTYLLNKGERVLSPNQNKDLNNFMKNADSNKSSGQSQKNVYNVSVTVQGNGQDNPSDLGAKIGESLIRTIAKQEINNASRLGNQLNKTTSFA